MYGSSRVPPRASIGAAVPAFSLLTCFALLAGCSNTGGSDGPRADRGGSSPADTSVVGRRDGGTDRARVARAAAAADRDLAPPAQGTLRNTLAYPTGDRNTSLVMLTVDAPEQVRVGQPYQYTLRVANLTDTPLHGVQVRDLRNDVPAEAQGIPANAGGPATRPARTNNGGGAGGAAAWDVGTLAPKETKTRQLSATADEVGTVGQCLSVTYNPTLCVATRVVRPELQLAKRGPEQVLICQEINYGYTVTNTGTGVAQNVRVEDTLPEGLTTQDGGRTVSLPVGDLNQGQSKEVTARVRAARTGDFTSRAVARSGAARGEAAEGLEAYSREVRTTVRQPVLAVDVEGPESRYIGEAVDYRVTVRNTGDVASERTTVALTAPGGTERLAPRDLGTIDAGQAKTFTVSSRAGRAAGDLKLTATATATCAKEASDDATVAIRTIPALQLECVDGTDPVRVGGNIVYTITVRNEGSGPDTNVNVRADIPEEMDYVGAGRGASDVKANGRRITMATIPTLAAGATATWTVEVKANRAGDVRFGVELTSDSLTKPAGETEPTRIINEQGK
jgi:uncharacterized repeat protein (TIGR01451 family)